VFVIAHIADCYHGTVVPTVALRFTDLLAVYRPEVVARAQHNIAGLTCS
jgi:hypothetical protein